MARTAVLSFAGDADQRIAGLPWAARAARNMAEAGYERIVLPPVAPATLAEVARVAPGLEVATGEVDDGEIVEAVRPEAARILRETGKAGDGPVSRLVNRPVSRLLSRIVLDIPGIRPLHASLATALIGLLMFAALIAGDHRGLILGGLLFQAASIVDGVDGEIARATFRASRSGALLDSVIDVATTILFILGVTANLSERGGDTPILLASWGLALFLLGLAVILWHGARSSGPFNFNHVKRHYRERVAGTWLEGLIRFLTIVTSRDFFALLFAILIVVGLPSAVLTIFAAAATVWILFVLGSIRLASGSWSMPSAERRL